MYKKKTLRNMAPTTRRYARILNDLQGTLKRLQNLTEHIARLELDSTALLNATRQDTKHANLDEFVQDQLQDDNGAELEKRIDAAEIFYDPALKDVDQEIIPGRIAWEKVSTTHVVLDPKTGECETTKEVHHEQVH